ncbi:MAG: hypothetical protein H7X80_06405, partial [bacterium]|nr:hypothetical protein [Candidatus Kapabacteria bacterium]
ELAAPGDDNIRRYLASGGTYRRYDNRTERGSIVVNDGGSVFFVPRRDFTYYSFQSNVVLRWEWLRGSTAYFVWQRSSEVESVDASPVNLNHWVDAVTAWGRQAIALKVAYWIPID